MFFRINQDLMDRYLAWLNIDGDEIFKLSSPKLVFWGFVLTIIIVLLLAITGFSIWV